MNNNETFAGVRFVRYLRKSTRDDDKQALSIEAQDDATTDLVQRHGLSVVPDAFVESASAKVPGRPILNETVALIEGGEANGIVCWKLDRLARNPLDGGRIMQLLADGTLKYIVTTNGVYDGKGTDPVMMSILFGMATQYSTNLASDVRRGNEKALRLGYWPNRPRLGYRRAEDKRMVPDPERFAKVQEMWRMRIEGRLVSEIWDKTRNDWKLRTPRYGRQGGSLLSLSQVHTLFKDPFYAGIMRWKGKTFDGNHEAMITWQEFEHVQSLTKRGPGRPSGRCSNLWFTYRGLIACGACGGTVTGERTTNRYGTTYFYYRCTRRDRKENYCDQPSIEVRSLERQLGDALSALTLPDDVAEALVRHLDELHDEQRRAIEKQRRDLVAEQTRLEQRLERLRTLLLDEVVTEEDYVRDREDLLGQRRRLVEQVQGLENADPFQPLRDDISFAKSAASSFRTGDEERKRQVVQKTSSNLLLQDKTVLVVAKKPLAELAAAATIPRKWASRDVIPTLLRAYTLPEGSSS